MTRQEYSERGRADYEADVARTPLYPDGTPRKAWDALCAIAKYSWAKPRHLGVTSHNPECDGDDA